MGIDRSHDELLPERTSRLGKGGYQGAKGP
jgi:hypothetical protein